jgi:prepilin-type processing-associated H-X9-DG protein
MSSTVRWRWRAGRVAWGVAIIVIALPLGAALYLRMVEDNLLARTQCASRMRQINQAILRYSNDHRGHYPPTLAALLHERWVERAALECPACGPSPSVPTSPRNDYIYTIPRAERMMSSVAADRVVLHEPLSNHAGNGLHVLFADGSVEWHDRAAGEALLAELAAGFNPPRADKVRRKQ